MKSTEFTLFSRKFKPRYLPGQAFYILRWTSFLMIPVSTLYDEYIDLPKLTEQKNPFEYIVPPPPPLKRGRNNNSQVSNKYGSNAMTINIYGSHVYDAIIFLT